MSNSEIDLIGSEITYLYIHITAIREIIKQSKVHFEIYKKYFEFFHPTYEAFHHELIHRIFRLTDTHSKVTSLPHLLKEHNRPDKAKEVTNHSTLNKIIQIRHTFLAHKNKKSSLSQNKVNEFYSKNETTLDEIGFLKPHTKIRSQLKQLFEDLS